MFYRIMTAPPGYGPDEKYMVGAYETIDLDSHVKKLLTESGGYFAATLEEARRMLPTNAKLISTERVWQHLELWEA